MCVCVFYTKIYVCTCMNFDWYCMWSFMCVCYTRVYKVFIYVMLSSWLVDCLVVHERVMCSVDVNYTSVNSIIYNRIIWGLFAVAIPHPFPIRGHGFQYFFKDFSLFAFVDTVTGTVWQIFQDLFGRQYLSVVLKQRRQRSFQMFLDGDGSLFVVGQSRTQRISCFQCSWRGPGGGEGNRQRGWTLLPLSLSWLLLLLL